MTITETLYIQRNNTFSLQLYRGENPLNLAAIDSFELHISNGRVFSDPSFFTPKNDGIVEITIGLELTPNDAGLHFAHLITYDSYNTKGVRFPNFRLRILP